MCTFVTVGNGTLPFTRLLQAICEVAQQLPQPVFVQFGADQSFSCPVCTSVAFLEMGEFEKRVTEAELLILHAGAGSVMHAVRAGKIPVVMPRLAKFGEIVDDHQLEFAHALEKTGKVFVAHDAATLVQAATSAMQQQQSSGDRVICDSSMIEMVRHALVKSSINCGG